MPEFKAPTPDRCGVPSWSQRLLLARRLVEAGVRLVTVDLRWWDTHVQGFDTMRNGFLPRWDRAYSALIEDLHHGDCSRARWFWRGASLDARRKSIRMRAGIIGPMCFSAAMAGGGIQGGRVVGASDAQGAEPAENPRRRRMCWPRSIVHLDIDTQAQYADFFGRPHPVLPSGEVISELVLTVSRSVEQEVKPSLWRRRKEGSLWFRKVPSYCGHGAVFPITEISKALAPFATTRLMRPVKAWLGVPQGIEFEVGRRRFVESIQIFEHVGRGF